MVFSGIPFLYYFLPAVLVLYYSVPRAIKNKVLLASGLFFYFYGEQLLVFLMLFTAFWDYSCALLIRSAGSQRRAKLILAAALTVDLGILCYFKYTDFLIESINQLTGAGLPLLKIALPIGISFYTFQSMSYVIDVYRGEVEAQTDPLDYATYLTLFPQLIAGPIVRYSTVAAELRNRTHTIPQFAEGVRRFTIGLSKKILLANVLGEFCSAYAEMPEKTALLAWVYALAYAMQIYFDFSGYSDMAIGLGKLFGFRFLENFRYPFVSKSVTEFWRRWHISLGTWFRDYLYIPLGGNRRHWLLNVLVVWFVTGMWHGAGWTFIFWGLYNGLFLVLEKAAGSAFLRLAPDRFSALSSLRYLYSVPVLAVGFVIFGGEDLGAVIRQLRLMFDLSGGIGLHAEAAYYLRDYAWVFAIAVFASLPLGKTALSRLLSSENGAVRASVSFVAPIATAVLFVLCTAEIVDSSFNPFLYFRF